jgi:cell division protein FtsZ
MEEMGKAMMGTGEAEGDDRAREAAEKAIANPLLDGVSMQGAKGVIISITGGEDMRLMEVDEAANHIKELVDPDANIIWGSAFNDDLEGKLRVSVVATGIDADAVSRPRPEPAKVFTFPSAREKAEDAEMPAEEVAEEAIEEAVPLAKDEIEPTEALETPEEIVSAEPTAEAEEASEIVGETEEPLTLETPAEQPEATRMFDDTVISPTPSEHRPAFNSPTFTVRAAGEAPLHVAPDTKVETGEEAAPVSGEAEADDELVLNADNIVGKEKAAERPAPAVNKWIAEDDKAEATAKPARGGTLFERMSNIARGAAKVETEEKKAASGGGDSLDIPHFLNRQNNQ